MEVIDAYTYLGLKIDSPLSFEPALKDLNIKVNHKLIGKVLDQRKRSDSKFLGLEVEGTENLLCIEVLNSETILVIGSN